jgi:endonuclease/exonuclease/phosphatase family metal-dependent hydrolase
VILLYAQSPAFLGSSVGVRHAVGLGIALLDAALAVIVLAQAGAAALLGSSTGSARHEWRDGISRSTAAFAGGAVWMVAVAILHTVQPLPFSNRFVPAAVGLLMLTGLVAVTAVAATLVVTALWPATEHPDVADRPLRVLTFDIEQGLTLGQLDLDELAGFVERADPDVVMMQEVGRGWSLSGMTDGAEWFSPRLRMPFVWGPAADNQFGNAVYSRVPITDHEVLSLGKGNGTQDRSAVFVTLDRGNGRDLHVIGTHSRTNQDVDRCTMPTSNANCPDWIFVTPDLGLSPVTIAVDRPDHRPITAEITTIAAVDGNTTS